MTTFAKKNKAGGRKPAGGMGLVSNNRLKKTALDAKSAPSSEKPKIGGVQSRIGAAGAQNKPKSNKPLIGGAKYKVGTRSSEVDVNKIASDAVSAVDNFLGPSDGKGSKYSDKSSDKNSKGVPSIYQNQHKYSPRKRTESDQSSGSNTAASNGKPKYQPKRDYKKPWQRPQTAGLRPDSGIVAKAAEERKAKDDRSKKASDIVSKRKQFKPALIPKRVESHRKESAKEKRSDYEIEVEMLKEEPEEAKQHAPKPYQASEAPKHHFVPSPNKMRKLKSDDVRKGIPEFEHDPMNDPELVKEQASPVKPQQDVSNPKSTKKASKMIGDIKKKIKKKNVHKASQDFVDETTGITMDTNEVEDVHLDTTGHTEDPGSSHKLNVNNYEEEKMVEFNISDKSKGSSHHSGLIEAEEDEDDNLLEINDAFNFADDNFDLDDGEKTPLDCVGLDEIQEDEEILDEFTSQKRELDNKIVEYETEIDERWKTLTELSDENKAKLCYEFFKDNINDDDDINDSEKMEKVHKFIKKQEVKGYRSFCFE